MRVPTSSCKTLSDEGDVVKKTDVKYIVKKETRELHQVESLEGEEEECILENKE